jgi:phosphate-selective porin OprO/OprP
VKKLYSLIAIALLFSASAWGQSLSNPIPYFTFNKGFGVHPPDSSFSLNLRFRMQNRFGATSISEDNLNVNEYEAIVRRLRLRFDGHVYSKNLTYVLQLSFARGDLDYENSNFPNIIRDAMIIYRFHPKFAIGMGQTKLPGNRQRINSSGDLQFADRSNVNATFNIDRDFGLQFYHENNLGKTAAYTWRAAISSGDGRNIAKTDDGLAYSTRLEFFPLGRFTNGGDYFESDLAREPKPKISVAGFYLYDDRATRSGGTLGKFLHDKRSFSNYGADFLMKYKGIALSSELVKREAKNPITVNPTKPTDVVYIYNGWGSNTELSYLFKSNWALAGRLTMMRPQGAIQLNKYEVPTDFYTLGLTRYIHGHRLKVQSDLTYKNVLQQPVNPTSNQQSHWQIRFQIELGI